ncbi:hypothetical protein Tco_0698656 [Tanacetum coccineum]
MSMLEDRSSYINVSESAQDTDVDIQLMYTTMVPEQVKPQKIQAGVQVSRLEDKDVIFSTGSALDVIIFSALNPCFNVSGVDYLIENISRDLEFEDDGFATRSLDWFHESFQGLTQLKKESRGVLLVLEYEQYLKTDFVSGLQPKDFASYDVLGFWKSKEN